MANVKDLIVNDRDFAVEMLTRYGYFSLIGGYKNIYINKSVRKYKRGTTFEDIVNLYKFDEELRSLFLKNILKFERKLHSVISYHFTQIYYRIIVEIWQLLELSLYPLRYLKVVNTKYASPLPIMALLATYPPP